MEEKENLNENVKLSSELTDEELDSLKGGVAPQTIEVEDEKENETSHGTTHCCNSGW